MTRTTIGPDRRPVALVTGASSGIGAELARILARERHDLVLVARTAPALEGLAAELRAAHDVAVTVAPADLAAPDGVDRVVAALADAGRSPDVLVNNAGFGASGHFDEIPWATQRDMIAVNVTALTGLTRRLVPPMVARGHGRVLNVASTAAFQPGPLMAVYYATKAYVLSFSEALAEELRHTGVTVTALCPGPTATGFAAAAGMTGSRLFRTGGIVGDARTVAAAGYRAMCRGRRVAIPGRLNQLVAFSTRLVPRRAATTLSRLTQEHR